MRSPETAIIISERPIWPYRKTIKSPTDALWMGGFFMGVWDYAMPHRFWLTNLSEFMVLDSKVDGKLKIGGK